MLVVDASQGVEAQTIANVYIALDNNLEIIPVVNKIDLPAADPDRVKDEIEHVIGLDCSEALEVSAKSGIGIKELIETIIRKIPPPKANLDLPLKALIYDSWFDNYLGALALVRLYDGSVKKGDEVYVMGTDKKHIVLDLMYPNPVAPIKTNELKAGEVGIVVLGLKDVASVSVGDTITLAKNRAKEPIGGFEKAKPFVFAGLYPIDTDKFEDLRDALDKLKALKKGNQITEDDESNGEKKIQNLTDKFCKEVDAIASAKEKEIMEL